MHCAQSLCVEKAECSKEDVDDRMCTNEMWAIGVCSNETNDNRNVY